jgi:hypothetical protein
MLPPLTDLPGDLPDGDGEFPPGEFPPTGEPGPTPSPCQLEFGSVTWENGKLNVPIAPC